MIYNVVKFSAKTNKFSLWRREWHFQGDRPDYTFIGNLTRETAIGLVKAGESADFDLKDIPLIKEYNREFDRIHKERAKKKAS